MSAKLRQMREKVLEELKHVPDWPFPQGELRMLYWMRRMHSLGKKATVRQTAREVLEECLAYLKKDHPDFDFKYDKDFFETAKD